MGKLPSPALTLQHKTIESVLERGENLDNLVERSNTLSAQSKMFYKTAKKVCTVSSLMGIADWISKTLAASSCNYNNPVQGSSLRRLSYTYVVVQAILRWHNVLLRCKVAFVRWS